ncbi:uncharacterized protein LOC129610957 isoform X2 [Condylostylus longicornis]|uniref:uncharacterized protein LOC129610957 isoform X2 n=1 Tax=Condylostylus longicornis TaxID=2530218 RepID=UPI00244E2B2C|nr:uncharacterized protein LOC129610957 isoform X2 [Condylostylus longicornis]
MSLWVSKRSEHNICDKSGNIPALLQYPNITNTEINDTDEVVAFAATEIKEFLNQDNLTEAEIGIIKTNDDLIYVDIGHVNISHEKVMADSKVKNEEIQNLTIKMIEDDNKAIVEIDKKITLENEEEIEVTSVSPEATEIQTTPKEIIQAVKSKQPNDDLIIIRNDQSSQTITDLIVDDDCSSEEKSEEYKYIEDSLKNTKNQINTTQIDFSDFIALIPADDVRDIFRLYYRKDKEVQRAYAYLNSKDFLELKNKILAITEVNILIKYLRKFGFDIINFLQTITKLVGDPAQPKLRQNQYTNYNITSVLQSTDVNNHVESASIKSIEYDENQNSTTIIEHGLHGLIDSILDILPQDQIISLFFEKLETNYEFSNLVNNIGNDEFSRILKKVENSIELKHLIYTLHNNGIYVERIVDSLKGYFFLGF